MKDVISVKNMRESDLSTIRNGISGRELMYRAALGIYSFYDWNGRIAIVTGTGNNAGDGYALSLILKANGKNPVLLLCEDKFSSDGKYYFDKAVNEGIPYQMMNENTSFDYDVIVDCIFGTGFHGKPSKKYEAIIKKINNSSAYIISADINSGLNGENGLYECAIKSNLCVSIGQIKYGLLLNEAKDVMKKLVNAEIGINPLYEEGKLIEEEDIRKFFPERKHMSNKGNYGYVGIMGGSKNYPGAVKLALMGEEALYTGAGVSRVIVPESISSLLYPHVTETTLFPLKCNNEGNMLFEKEEIDQAVKGLKALSVGIGWGVSEENKKILTYLLNTLEIPLVIDADGLNNLATMDLDLLKKTKAKVILTPHLKEFSRLIHKEIKEIEENLVQEAKDFAQKYDVTVLLKGPTTIVTSKDKVYLTDKGTPGMATAGSGDVLTGIITGVLGIRNDDVALASIVAAYLNGASGEKAASVYGSYGMVSSDTARSVSFVLKDILGY